MRILRITARQLVGWEKAGLVKVADSYSFFELLQLKKLRDLRAKRVRSAVIRQSLDAMQKQVAGMENPLLEAGTFSTGTRVAFRHQGRAVEPIAGQFIMDFEHKVILPAKVKPMRAPETAADHFAKGIGLEEDPATQLEAIEAYKKAIELEPRDAMSYAYRGVLLMSKGDLDGAIADFTKGMELDSKSALFYASRGMALLLKGKEAEAQRDFDRCLELDQGYKPGLERRIKAIKERRAKPNR